MIWRASLAGTALAAASAGMSSTAPALMRLTLFPMKALGLERSMATSIWSSDTLAGRWSAASRPAVSPGWTRTWVSPLGSDAGAGSGVAGAGTGRVAWAGGEAGAATGGCTAGAAPTAAGGTTGRAEGGGTGDGRGWAETPGASGAAAAGRRLGGSNSRV